MSFGWLVKKQPLKRWGLGPSAEFRTLNRHFVGKITIFIAIIIIAKITCPNLTELVALKIK